MTDPNLLYRLGLSLLDFRAYVREREDERSEVILATWDLCEALTRMSSHLSRRLNSEYHL